MTKLKSKKMSKSTFAVIMMAIVMVAMLAFGGTYAYFTAVGPSLTTGSGISTATVQLGAGTTVQWVTGNVVSGQSVIQKGNDWAGFSVTNESTVPTYIFLTFEADFEEREGLTTEEQAKVQEVTAANYATAGDGAWYLDYTLDIYHETNNADGKWVALTGTGAPENTYYYLAPAKTGTAESIAVFDDIKFFGKSASTSSAQGVLMGGTISVTMNINSIQTISETTGDPFVDAMAAYTALNG